MQKFIVLFFALVLVTGYCFAQDVVEGYWLSVDEKTNEVTAGWQIYQQDGKLYGKILSFSDVSDGIIAHKCKDSYAGFPVFGKVNQMKLAGTPWIYGLTMSKPGEWKGGRIIDPNDGKDYVCEITFRPADGKKYKQDTLEMRGKIGPFGRSQFWLKSDEAAASSLASSKL